LISLEELHDSEGKQILKDLEDIKAGLEQMKYRHRESDELVKHQERLRELECRLRERDEQKMKEGKVSWKGQAYLHELLEYCFELAHNLYDPGSVDVDDSLRRMKIDLQNTFHILNDWHKTAGREKMFTSQDLEYHRNVLLGIERRRSSGIFLTEPGSREVPGGQAILSSLLHRCYRLLHLLEEATEVDPELVSLSTQLEEIKQRLQRLSMEAHIKKESVAREKLVDELQRLQNSLDMVERQRDACKSAFIPKEGDKIPHGQAYLHNLLASCYNSVDTLNRELYA
jgi:hypothetical protein